MTKKPVWREYFDAIILALILALIIRAFVIQAYQIPSASMLDTLLIGDRLLVNKFIYGVKIPFTDKTVLEISDPEVGDVMVFAYPEDPSKDFIKRIIGIPGDTLEMRDKVLYRNGKVVNEPYVRHTDQRIQFRRDNFKAVVVPEGKYFVMGDNRDNSDDSRRWGFVDRTLIRGKAWRLYWSWGDKPGDAGSSGYEDSGPRWGRLGNLVE
ncbi:MAG: signal peptidase I [Deltaproteobacteria bacterium]|jgi:signal peptidase I|nr:signal peptidase I [Deltaproteobacteria bacterium]